MKHRFSQVITLSIFAFLLYGFTGQQVVFVQEQPTASEESTKASGEKVQEIQKGQRVRIQLKNGYQVKGQIASKLADRIKLDLSKEKSALSGTIDVNRDDISSLTRLEPVEATEQNTSASKKKQKTNPDSKQSKGKSDQKNQEQKKQDNEKKEKKKSGDQQAEENEWPPEPTDEQRQLLKSFPPEEWGQKRYQRLDRKYEFQLNSKEKQFLKNWGELQEARKVKSKYERHQLLDEFPPEEGWGPEEYRHIKDDLAGLEAKGIPARNPKQRRFLEVFSDWKKAYEEYKQHQKEKEQEKDGQK